MRAFWRVLLPAGFLRLFGDLLAFVGPWCVEHIVDAAYRMAENPKETKPEVQEYDVNNMTANGSFVQDIADNQSKVRLSMKALQNNMYSFYCLFA